MGDPNERRRSKACDGISPVEFRTVIRLRPLQKKEREDHVVLEVKDNRESETCKLPSAVMRAMPRTEHNAAPPFGSPEPSRFDSHEEEFRFDVAFGESSSQDLDVFGQIGRPMSSKAMEPLFSDNQPMPQAFVNLFVGTAGAGKTYLCWGNTSQSLRKKLPSDGIIPRLTDSLFGQYQRLASLHPRTSKSSHFAVNISALQVNQPKNPKSQSSDAGKLHDLLQHVSSPRTSIQRSDFERNVSAESSTSIKSGPSTLSDRSGSSTNSADHKVYIDQDPLTHDFRAVNAQVRGCRTSEDARETLQQVMSGIRKLSNKRNQTHVVLQLQPVLIDRKSGSTKRKGSSIVFLDMAGSEDLATSRSRHRANSKRMKDSLPGRSDAHASVLHCLRSILFNEQQRQANNQSIMHQDHCQSSALENRHSMSRATSLKQVPYLQHKTTMLLQPSFSANRTERTIVTMFMAASPSHRDYMEKRALLVEIESLWKPFHPASVIAFTGLRDSSDHKSQKISDKDRPRSRSRGVRKDHPGKTKVRAKSQPPSSESAEDFSLPPPIAPPNPSLLPAQPLTHRASAPFEEDPYERTVIEMDRSVVNDFPGVDIHGGQMGVEAGGQPPSVDDEDPPVVVVESSPQPSRREVKVRGKPMPNKRGSSKVRGRSRSPLRPAPRAGNEYSQPSRRHSIDPPLKKKTAGRVTDVPTKKKWSKKVETTTTVVETCGDSTIDSPDVEAIEPTRAQAEGEMEDLRQQNFSLQRQLESLKARKSVSWRDDRAKGTKGLEIPNNRSRNERKGSERSVSAPRAGRLLDTPVLREPVAKHRETSSSSPVVFSVESGQSAFQTVHHPVRSRSRSRSRHWD